jgi:MFS family permease
MRTERRPSRLPAATWALLGSLYLTQYLGIGFFLVALVAILREQGAPLEQLGLVYLLGLTWAFKFLWAPLVDRLGVPRIGHFRGWLLVMQTGMVVTLLVIGTLDPVADFGRVYALCLLLALLAATQDIAADGLACRLLPPAERGLGNGVQVAGQLLGNLLGAGGVLMAYPLLGWPGAMAILAAGTLVSLVQVLLFREPAHRPVPMPLAAVARRIWGLWRRPGGGHWLLMLLLYPLGVSLAYAVITPSLVDAGWALDRIGLLVSVVGSLLGVPAALATGLLIRRYGRRPVMIGAALLQIPGILALLVPALGHTGELAVAVAVGLYFLSFNPVVAVIGTLMMDHASPETPATDYAAQYSLYMLCSMLAASAGTALAGRFGYGPVLAMAATAATAMALVSLRWRDHAQPPPATAPDPATAPKAVLAGVPVRSVPIPSEEPR